MIGHRFAFRGPWSPALKFCRVAGAILAKWLLVYLLIAPVWAIIRFVSACLIFVLKAVLAALRAEEKRRRAAPPINPRNILEL